MSFVKNDQLSNALSKASLNRAEMETVLEHYKEDKQKYEAASFLISNMDGHFSFQSKAIDDYYKTMDSVFTNLKCDSKLFKQEYYNAGRRNGRMDVGCKYLYDIKNIKARYLIEHIDRAFSVWKQSWNGNVNFDIFCNYILPYRIDREPLSDWLKQYTKDCLVPIQSKFGHSQYNSQYLYSIYYMVNRGISRDTYYPDTFLPEFPLTLLPKMKVGNCESYTSYCIARLRSIGIPVAWDFVPQWGERSMGHSWASLVLSDSVCIAFGQNERLGEHFQSRQENVLPKVFRKTFKKQLFTRLISESKEPKPVLFDTPYLMDVTDLYTKVHDITVSLYDNPLVKQREYVYLAVFNDKTWSDVQFGKRTGNVCRFNKMGYNCVYLPVVHVSVENTVPAGDPILLKADGTLKILKPNMEQRQKVKLTRKYKVSGKLMNYCSFLCGGKFQLANNSDFSDAITIAEIENITENRYHSLTIDDKRKFKYFRYLIADNSPGDMAELEFYDGNRNLLIPKHYFSKNKLENDERLKVLFDKDIFTNFSTKRDSANWIAMEFNHPVDISEIRFLPRNDGNFIEENDSYELSYWNQQGWVKIQEMKGTRNGILYVDNVPTNALLLLHNKTKGREERIFTYEGGKQIWW